MALTKQMTNDAGISTSYHKVESVNLSNGLLCFDIGSYVSEEYRQLNKPASYVTHCCEITLAEEESMGIRSLCYYKLKEEDEWKDATDC